MITVEAFKREHLAGVKLHPSQVQFQSYLDELQDDDEAVSGFDNGDLVMVGGARAFDGCLFGYLFFTDKINPRAFLSVYRVVNEIKKLYVARGIRVAGHFDGNDGKNERWARLLGMEPAGVDVINGKSLRRFEARAPETKDEVHGR